MTALSTNDNDTSKNEMDEPLARMEVSDGSEGTLPMQVSTEVPSQKSRLTADEKRQNCDAVTAEPSDATVKSLPKKRPSKVLYSCAVRGDTLLVNAGDVSGKDVNYTIRHLLDRPHRLGWDIYSSDSYPTRKGIKFHIYQARDTGGFDVWIYAAVYNSQRTSRSTVQTFIMKLVILTETAWLTQPNWLHGDTLACQEEYEALLMQQMLQVRSLKASLLMSSTMALARIMIMQNRQLLTREEERKHAQEMGLAYPTMNPYVTKIMSRLEVEVISDSERTTCTDRDMTERNEAELEREMRAHPNETTRDLTIAPSNSFDSATAPSMMSPQSLDMLSPTTTSWWKQTHQQPQRHVPDAVVLAPNVMQDSSPKLPGEDNAELNPPCSELAMFRQHENNQAFVSLDGGDGTFVDGLQDPTNERMEDYSPTSMVRAADTGSRQLPNRGSDMELSIPSERRLLRQNQELAAQVDILRNQLDHLRKQTEMEKGEILSDAETETQSLKEELHQLDRAVDEVLTDKGKLSSTHASTVEELKSKDKKIVILGKRLQLTQREKGEMQLELTKVRTRQETVAEKHSQAVALLEAKEQELAAITKKSDLLAVEKENLLGEVKQVRAEFSTEKQAHTSWIGELQEKLKKMQDRHDDVCAEKDDLANKGTKASEMLESTQKKLAETTRRLGEVRKEKHSIVTEMVEVQAQMAKVKDQMVAASEAERQELGEQIDQLRQANDRLYDKHSQTLQELESKGKEINRLHDNALLRAQASDVDTRLNNKIIKQTKHDKSESHILKEKIQELRDKLRRTEAYAEAEKETLTDRFCEVVRLVESKEAALQRAKEHLNSISSENVRLVAVVNEFQARLTGQNEDQVSEALQEEQLSLGTEIQKLGRAAVEAKTEKDSVAYQFSQTNEKLKSKELELSSLRKELHQLREARIETDGGKEALRDNQGRIAQDPESTVQKLRMELEEMDFRMIKQKEDQKQEFETECQSMQAKLGRMRLAKGKIHAEKERVSREHEKTVQKLETKTSELSEKSDRLAEVSRGFESSQMEHRKNIEELRERCIQQDQHKKEETKRLREMVLKLEQQLTDKDKIIIVLEREIKESEARPTAHSRAMKTRHAADDADREELLSSLRKETVRSHQQSPQELSNFASQTDQKEIEHASEVTSLRQELQHARDKLSTAHQGLQGSRKMKDLLGVLQSSYQSLREEMDLAEMNHRRLATEWLAKLTKLEEELDNTSTALKLKDVKMNATEENSGKERETFTKDYETKVPALQQELTETSERLADALKLDEEKIQTKRPDTGGPKCGDYVENDRDSLTPAVQHDVKFTRNAEVSSSRDLTLDSEIHRKENDSVHTSDPCDQSQNQQETSANSQSDSKAASPVCGADGAFDTPGKDKDIPDEQMRGDSNDRMEQGDHTETDQHVTDKRAVAFEPTAGEEEDSSCAREKDMDSEHVTFLTSGGVSSVGHEYEDEVTQQPCFWRGTDTSAVQGETADDQSDVEKCGAPCFLGFTSPRSNIVKDATGNDGREFQGKPLEDSPEPPMGDNNEGDECKTGMNEPNLGKPTSSPETNGDGTKVSNVQRGENCDMLDLHDEGQKEVHYQDIAGEQSNSPCFFFSSLFYPKKSILI